MEQRISHHNITSLAYNEIFVFGSNEGGTHGKGAAKLALKWGAKWGVGNGMSGKTYGIPTKNKSVRTLPLRSIEVYINQFINYASICPKFNFLVTEIGCGLAGYSPKDIAPMFRDALDLPNVFLPKSFHKILTEQ